MKNSNLLLPILFISLQLTLSLPHLLPPHPYIRYTAFVCLIVQYVVLVGTNSGNSTLEWGIGLATTPQLLKGLVLFIIHAPATAFHRRHCNDIRVRKRVALWDRLQWIFELVYAPRGIGWNWEIPYIYYGGADSKTYVLLVF